MTVVDLGHLRQWVGRANTLDQSLDLFPAQSLEPARSASPPTFGSSVCRHASSIQETK
jgi:hypothetical protein